MNNTYQLKQPINQAFKPVVKIIIDSTSVLGIPVFIAGATARDLVLHHVFERNIGRKTYDIDTAVLISSWDAYDKLRQQLIKEGLKETVVAHRLLHQETGLPVDIIPFGEITGANNQIEWPPEYAISMSVAGFREAYDHALNIEIAPNYIIKVSSLAGLALLKLIAWGERRHESNKDAQDFLTILKEYSNIELDRLYEEYVPGDFLEFNPDRLGAFLLGYDIGMLFGAQKSSDTLDSLKTVLITQKEPLLDSLLKESNSHDSSNIEQWLNDLQLGLNRSVSS
ncbi:hypothetical protein [Marinomonas fungiae]|uniref:Predicted nucleotidyltransferase n=1 Tax=Marinomonas fungiae TaxID=1137284 RepID=A0A0K6IKU2_9GAMM|nr:hypothetical protein [Marinomonas fungiae]CUB03724.1 Predicted nucleotidyltransferase [Marinomonas fungiae]